MSQTLKIVLPDQAAERLRELSEDAGEPAATLASRFIKERIRSTTPLPAPPSSPAHRMQHARPVWLEPQHDSRTWRAEMWVAILELHARYPERLGALQEGWWGHPLHVETLAALATWRHELDEHGQDPREELLFQAQLADYAKALTEHARGVAKAWQPGPPPDTWAAR